MATFNFNCNVTADSELNAKIKIAVITNIWENLTDSQFVHTLYPRIKKDKQFFKKIAGSSLIKML